MNTIHPKIKFTSTLIQCGVLTSTEIWLYLWLHNWIHHIFLVVTHTEVSLPRKYDGFNYEAKDKVFRSQKIFSWKINHDGKIKGSRNMEKDLNQMAWHNHSNNRTDPTKTVKTCIKSIFIQITLPWNCYDRFELKYIIYYISIYHV